jgi:hypothetical protein
VGKIAYHVRWRIRGVDCDFAHTVGSEDRARVGTAREIWLARK